MQNNNGVVNVRSSLTKVGKKRASENRFNVTKVAFADDGINYNLLSINLPQKDLAVSRTPLFDVWKNSENVLQNKILIFPDGIPILPSEYNFNIQMDIQGENRKRSVATVRADVNFPEFVRRQGVSKRIMYYNTSPVESAQMQDVIVGFSSDALPVSDRQQYISVTLHDSTYFDIAMSPNNINLHRRNATPDEIIELRKNLIPNASRRVRTERELFEATGRSASRFHVLSKNFEEGLDLGVTEPNTTPKTINCLAMGGGNTATFLLRYRGNYAYKNAGTDTYQTHLTFFSEVTGSIEHIKLNIISSLPK